MARRSEHSREQIRAMALDAATRIIAEHGLAGLSVRKIAAAIGYAVGSLYLVFDNLDDLILQVNSQTLDELHQFVLAAGAAETDPAARVHCLARAYLEFAGSHRARWGAVFEHVPESYAAPEWHQARVQRLFGLVEQALRELLPHAPPERITQAARALWGGVHGICILAFTGKLDVVRAGSVETVLGVLVSTYLAGLKSSPPVLSGDAGKKMKSP